MDHDINQEVAFQEKVFILADEVLRIIKELHQEHEKLVNSKLIAKKMFNKESIKEILFDRGLERIDKEKDSEHLKEAIDNVLNKIAELVPGSMMDQLNDVKSLEYNKTVDPSERFNLAVKLVKKHVCSISGRLSDLEDLLPKIVHYLSEMETYLTSEISSARGMFQEDSNHEESIVANVAEIMKSFDVSSDINTIKSVIISKLENITGAIEEKKEQNILRLKETERTIEEMSRKMNEIANEAEAVKRRSLEVEIESYHDNLTTIYNRKAYDKKIDETLSNLDRYKISSSLMLFDIDHFKKINDSFGHHIGDLTLKKVAMTFKNRLRKNDFIARYGGEEFVCILPHTNLEDARKVAEEIRLFIDGASFTFKGKKVPVTISAGVSTLREGDDALTVFERSDVALYMAKESGRNLVKTEVDVEKAGKSFSNYLIDSDIENE